MKYYIATRTRTQLLTYATCDTLEEAKQNLARYAHVWRVKIYEQDKFGYTTIVNLQAN